MKFLTDADSYTYNDIPTKKDINSIWWYRKENGEVTNGYVVMKDGKLGINFGNFWFPVEGNEDRMVCNFSKRWFF